MHPKYKTTYRVGNWAEYDRALVRRGDVTLWLTPDAIATWAAAGVGRRSGQLQYSDLAIETALTLSLLFHVPLRQTEGFLTSIFGMLGVDLTAPDHTTRSRRGQHLALALRRARPGTSLHLIVDSTGLSIVGEGEWAVAKHGGRGRRGWALVHGSRALGEPRSTSWPSWRQQVHDLDMKSRVHPKYKTQYHVGNWPAYDRALVQRGDITVWVAPDAIATWEAVGVGTRGGQLQYSDLAIETALTLRLIFHLPLRQTEGFLTSIFGMLGLDLSAPDHTTLSRRGQHLDLPLRRAPAGAGLHLIVDSTGLSIVGEGEWAAAKHGGRGRRGWKKLHLGVDRSGVIVARALTEASVDDATTGITLIEATDGALGRVTADAAYDTIGFYEAAGARGATVVVPPTRTANVSRYGPRSGARDRTILAVKERGRRRWKQTSLSWAALVRGNKCSSRPWPS